VISDFRLQVDEIYVLLGHYAAYGGESLPTFRDNLSVPSSRVKNNFLTLEDRTHRLSWNVVGKELPPLTA